MGGPEGAEVEVAGSLLEEEQLVWGSGDDRRWARPDVAQETLRRGPGPQPEVSRAPSAPAAADSPPRAQGAGCGDCAELHLPPGALPARNSAFVPRGLGVGTGRPWEGQEEEPSTAGSPGRPAVYEPPYLRGFLALRGDDTSGQLHPVREDRSPHPIPNIPEDLLLPLSLLKTAQNHPMLVELKNGETYNGHLVSCDNWMNINLREVICTSRDGDKFWRMPECYIRGSTIKYLRIPDEIIDMVKDEVVAKGRGRGGLQQQKQQKGRGMGGAGRGVFGGRGRGGIPGTGRGQQEKKPGRQAGKQ
ncbi:U6 snRNA-associated Sm-like protein LSm4 [Echinops telfairi]|uniref:U6 snRNA-associated Sm-like protein LSm4 n=2 Tax=Afrotheria TaxID=311790 RepID=A0ABM0IQP9_ECHTE|nr:U6 snRNA-associated Sm-like protein LSm4 [Echinops telfairi]